MLIKLEWLGYRIVKKNYDNTLNRFHPIPESYGQTDGRMDGQNCYINIARQYADARYKPTGCRLLPAVAARPYRHHQMMWNIFSVSFSKWCAFAKFESNTDYFRLIDSSISCIGIQFSVPGGKYRTDFRYFRYCRYSVSFGIPNTDVGIGIGISKY